MPYANNGEGDYTVARLHIDGEQGACSDEHYLAGSSSIQDGRDIPLKQDEAAGKARH